MSRLPDLHAVGALLFAMAAGVAAQPSTQGDAPRFGLGRAASAAQIAGWDIDVRPDGHGVRTGRGTVDQGQAIYDAQCAACHGTFGEATSNMAIAGGVKQADLKTGRASSLTQSDVIRTVGTKLNYATTLWDYINRAMPWANPQSLSIDQVYAVTAYVLHLNEIVPADFELNERNLLTLPMPNRFGMTTEHGMKSVTGKPDVQGSRCMKDCVREVKITSTLPEFARNAHGNLAEQKRPLGPYRGIDTTRYEAGKPAAIQVAAAAPVAAAAVNPQDVLKRNACTACHAVNNRVVGPGFVEIGAKYAGRADAEAYLVGKMKQGGVGAWGQIPMPAQPGLQDNEAKALAQWLLGGAK